MTGAWHEVRTIVERALDRPLADRAAFVKESCGGDPELERDALELIAAAQDASPIGRAIEAGAVEPPPQPPRAPEAGNAIGRYRLVRWIGGGGMGAVWQAEQDDPRRSVALKLLAHAFVSDEAIARFRFEAAVLARLRHPNVAMLFEAGTYDAGRPFLAMEFVEGARTIAAFVAERRLAVRERVELMLSVCDAVEHGHQRGVIHRDLKSANVLVDEHGHPKVIDFGIARAIDRDGAWVDATPNITRTGQVIGTIATMAPEQIENARGEVDARTDVYALGVILCEVLTGALPLDFTGLSLLESAKRIERDAPVLPTARDASLPRELDWIAGKALSKEKDRRYPTVSEFAADLRRFLDGAAVLAAPESRLYRARVFARKHRAGLAIAAIAVVSLVTVLVVALVSRAKEVAARGRAAAALGFLESMLASVRPDISGRDARVRDVLAAAEQDLARGFDGPPEVEAATRVTLGSSFLSLDLVKEAEPHLLRALELRERVLGKDDAETIEAARCVASLRLRQGRVREAEASLAELSRRATAALGPSHEQTLVVHVYHVSALDYLARYAEAEAESRAAIDATPKDDPRFVATREDLESTLVAVLEHRGGGNETVERARANYQRVTAVFGPTNVRTLIAASSLGRLMVQNGHVEDGLALTRTVFEERAKQLGPEHDQTLYARSTLLACERIAGRFDECVTGLRENIAFREKREGSAASRVLEDVSLLGSVLRELGRFDEALALVSRSRAAALAAYGADDPVTLRLDTTIAQIQLDKGDIETAVAGLRTLLASPAVKADPAGPLALEAEESLALSLRAPETAEEGKRLLEHVLAAHRERLGDDAPDTLRTMIHMIAFASMGGDDARVESLGRSAIEGLERLYGTNHIDVLSAYGTLATAYVARERFADAMPLQEKALAIATKLYGDDHPAYADISAELAVSKLRLGDPAGAEPMLARSGELRMKFYGPDSPYTRLSHLEQAAALVLLHRVADAARAARLEFDERGFNRVARALKFAGKAAEAPDLTGADATTLEFARGVADGLEREGDAAGAKVWRDAAGAAER